MPLRQFAPLAAVAGVEIVSLQKGYGAATLCEPERRFGATELQTADGGTFRETAALMKNLSLVVTVDTSDPDRLPTAALSADLTV